MGSHRYIDEEGLCHPEFHDQLDRAEKTRRYGGGPDGRLGPDGVDPAGRRPRPEAARVLAELHGLGLRTVMLTGDNPRRPRPVRELGVGEQRAGLLPDDKVTAIAEIDVVTGQRHGRRRREQRARPGRRQGQHRPGRHLQRAASKPPTSSSGRRPRPAPLADPHSRATMAMIRQNIAMALLTKAGPDPGGLRAGQPLDGDRR